MAEVIGMGVLTEKELRNHIYETDPPLIVNAEESCIKPATYDLRLGEEYIKEGRFEKLDEKTKPYLEIPQHDVVIVSSYETVNLPNNIVGRFGIRLGLVMKGLVLANEPQIDPGSKGRMFCILYNLSDEPIIIAYETTFATIEFQTTESPAPPYRGAYLTADHVYEVARDKLPKSGLKKLWDEQQQLKKDVDQRIERFYIIFFSIMGIIIAVLGVIIATIVLFR
jgi:deoxycytidine triphosphate deaminase